MKVGVVGVGKLGRIHGRIYRELEEWDLVGVSDPVRPEVEHLAGVPWFADYRELIDAGVEAVSIATPTVLHHQVAKFFLERGVHCLIEKPITVTMAEARDLLETARGNNVFVMVGMVERFNQAYEEARKMITVPQFIETHRLSPYPNRSLDISVVLDLMIHDLDIILDLVGSPVTAIDAVGVRALSPSPDIANARLHFANGCIANITASRISDEKMRRTRVFFDSNYISLDFAQHQIKAYRKDAEGIHRKMMSIPAEEPLKREILTFRWSIDKVPFSYEIAENASSALELALAIEQAMNSRQKEQPLCQAYRKVF
jgi:predicted dehydrogenase